MAKVLKTSLKVNKRTVILNVKLNAIEDKRLDELSLECSGGNRSEAVRYAIMTCRPKKKDLVEVPLPTPALSAQVQR